jgi:2-polyprenyl-6-methoxyphenol hydroxylase-like FAD-dependent oxidoreductase
MNTVETQCCIAGGGPAGIMAGLLLARAGVRATVLEKHPDFLRDFRGDTVHPSSLDVLDELGYLDDFLKLPHQELSRIRAHFGASEFTIADFTHLSTRRKFIAFMPQWDFLDFLVDKARAFPAFSLHKNTEATDLIEENGQIVGVRARTHDGPLEVRSPLTIAADGRHSTLRARSGLRVRDVGVPIDVVWLRLPRLASDPEQSLGWVQRGRFLALIERGDYWQIAFVIQKGGFDELKQGGIDGFRRELARLVPFFADRVEHLRSFDDVSLLVVTVDRLERWWRPGFLCIGDAAHAMSPVGGVGINLAIQDAVAAANILARPLADRALSTSDLARVQRRRTFPTRVMQATQVTVQNRFLKGVIAGKKPVQAGVGLKTLGRTPFMQHLLARFVGVGVRPEHVAT